LRRRRRLPVNRVTRSRRAGMMCGVSVQEATLVSEPQKPMAGRLSRLSPWWWGLIALVALLLIIMTLAPRIAPMTPVARSKQSSANPSAAASRPGRVYTQAMAAGRDFAGTDLSGARLAQLDLRGKDFLDTDASGAVFAGSLLNGANFAHANLRGADLRDACLRGAIFTAADLAGADFTGADITGATVAPAAISTAIGWRSTASPAACPLK
jgi:hypothetical protein